MDHLALLEDEVAAMAALLRDTDPARPVPSCPGWTVADLTAHLTGVHRWVLAALRDEGTPPYDEQPTSPAEYAEAATAMVARLRELPEDAPCWTFDRDDRTAGFWRRRQLQEVSVHRWDVDQHEIDPQVAEAGVTEVVAFFLPRQLHLGRLTLPPGTVTLDAGDRSWTLGGAEGPTATVRGTVQQLDLLLWGRLGTDNLSVSGDEDLAMAVLAGGLTP